MVSWNVVVGGVAMIVFVNFSCRVLSAVVARRFRPTVLVGMLTAMVYAVFSSGVRPWCNRLIY